MKIGAVFTNNGADWTGLDPLPVIDIYDLSDDSKVISAESLQEIGGGGYDYVFAAYDPSKDYFWKIDGGAAITNNKERYRRGWSGLAGAVPDAQAGVNGGLPTVDANNYIAGMPGTKNVLDDLTDITAAQVNAEVDTALSDYDGPTKAEMDTGHGLLATESKQDIIDGNVDDILVDTQDIQSQIGTAGAGLTDLGGMATGMKAEVNAEVADVLKVDTVSEMSQGAPPEEPTMEQMLNYLYRMWRNKTTATGDELAMYNNAGTTKLVKAVLTKVGSLFTKGKMGSGA